MDYDINKIKMIISDIDGVWTDGSIYVGNKDSEIKKFNDLVVKRVNQICVGSKNFNLWFMEPFKTS